MFSLTDIHGYLLKLVKNLLENIQLISLISAKPVSNKRRDTFLKPFQIIKKAPEGLVLIGGGGKI